VTVIGRAGCDWPTRFLEDVFPWARLFVGIVNDKNVNVSSHYNWEFLCRQGSFSLKCAKSQTPGAVDLSCFLCQKQVGDNVLYHALSRAPDKGKEYGMQSNSRTAKVSEQTLRSSADETALLSSRMPDVRLLRVSHLPSHAAAWNARDSTSPADCVRLLFCFPHICGRTPGRDL
jgi:hypothetical protein